MQCIMVDYCICFGLRDCFRSIGCTRVLLSADQIFSKCGRSAARSGKMTCVRVCVCCCCSLKLVWLQTTVHTHIYIYIYISSYGQVQHPVVQYECRRNHWCKNCHRQPFSDLWSGLWRALTFDRLHCSCSRKR